VERTGKTGPPRNVRLNRAQIGDRRATRGRAESGGRTSGVRTAEEDIFKTPKVTYVSQRRTVDWEALNPANSDCNCVLRTSGPDGVIGDVSGRDVSSENLAKEMILAIAY
jgi:hypothetical protein